MGLRDMDGCNWKVNTCTIGSEWACILWAGSRPRAAAAPTAGAAATRRRQPRHAATTEAAHRAADILHLLHRVPVLNGGQVANGVPHGHGAQRRAHLQEHDRRWDGWVNKVNVQAS